MPSVKVVPFLVVGLSLGACGGGGTSGFAQGDAGSTASAGSSHRSSGTGNVTTASMAVSGSSAISVGGTMGSSGGTSTTPHDAGSSVDAGQSSSAPVDAEAPVDVTEIAFDAFIGTAVVYGQSATELYAVDPNTHAVTKVGTFQGCGDEVIDIALDKTSTMYATSSTGVYTVDTSTAKCTVVALGGNYPNSLSFVPAGTLDPTEEALVGYQNPTDYGSGSTYVRIDTTTGAITNVGSLETYNSSGDIVSVIGGGTYLTVTGGSDCQSSDCLVEVNPATGALVKNYGAIQHSQVYGLAFWAGNVYGFDNAGQLFEVTFPAAGGLSVSTIAIPNAPLGLSFYGAGSTTAAPRL